MKEYRKITRRLFTQSLAVAGIGSVGMPLFASEKSAGGYLSQASYSEKLKISLNAFSFDKPLHAGTMTISDLLDYCARIGFDGVDLTGYYFPGYPAIPTDEFIYEVKKKAYRLGLGISGTGVKNDFTKIIDIVRQCGYCGFLPLETLGEGDHATKVEALYKKVFVVLNT